MSRVTPGTALEVKRRFWRGEAQADISRELGIAQSSVSDICTNRSFTYVPWPNGAYAPPSRDERKRRRDGLDGEQEALSRIADRTQAGAERAAPGLSLSDTIDTAAAEAEGAAAWRAELAEKVEQIKELSDIELDEELKRIVAADVQNLNSAATQPSSHGSVSPSDASGGPTSPNLAPPQVEALPWEDILRICGTRNRWVRLAKDKPNTQFILGVIYKALPPNDWAEPFVYPLLRSTAQILGLPLEEQAI